MIILSSDTVQSGSQGCRRSEFRVLTSQPTLSLLLTHPSEPHPKADPTRPAKRQYNKIRSVPNVVQPTKLGSYGCTQAKIHACIEDRHQPDSRSVACGSRAATTAECGMCNFCDGWILVHRRPMSWIWRVCTAIHAVVKRGREG